MSIDRKIDNQEKYTISNLLTYMFYGTAAIKGATEFCSEICVEKGKTVIDCSRKIKQSIGELHRYSNSKDVEDEIDDFEAFKHNMSKLLDSISSEKFLSMSDKYEKSLGRLSIQSPESKAVIFKATLSTDDAERARIVLDYILDRKNWGKQFWRILMRDLGVYKQSELKEDKATSMHVRTPGR